MTKIVLLSKEEIKAGQDKIKTNLTKLDAAIHINAVQCLLHAEKHGDTSLFRRLIVDTLDAKNSGYRVQGLINWMRKHSPMELKGDIINLTGSFDSAAQVIAAKKMFPEVSPDKFVLGERRPFLIDEANAHPFWTDQANAERVAKPVYQDTLLAPINRVLKDLQAAVDNTHNGQPIDPNKPFYDGIHADKVVNFAKSVKEMADALPKDATRDVRMAQKQQAELGNFIEANKPDSNLREEVDAETAMIEVGEGKEQQVA